MKTLSFNIIKPLAFTALLIVFAASFNTADGRPIKKGTYCMNTQDHCLPPLQCIGAVYPNKAGKCKEPKN